ncbi:hypothetical protein PFICI_10719 [Pestalotiopsis fici W106-1]|uniref:histone acetyltransferase n=1 Tax=Pestalotiopsis fici (strain W106-1 / CGMCC3.15140) TaxID=1229662 RepID=W3WSK8_PESFW|nr:uncharacterized protein PFICI_10719 [Pestalotiopsis fici W106-1]ETS76845.1 hypothetical protein PFICI_10719 [Pestalotiopsis fici W106-1]
MATTSRPLPEAGTSALVAELAQVLPKGAKFTAYHISTPPTISEPLCYAPANPQTQDGGSMSQKNLRARKPLKTYCEKHFLAIAICPLGSTEQVLAFALELYIYTTAHSSILFVAKADSTGYLGLLNLPKGMPSPIREVTTAFISYLVTNRARKGIQFVVNLFARSQSQYLFPGSVKNGGKHILDDRGLVKWWCRVLNPLLENQTAHAQKRWKDIQGYLIIPGLDGYETRAFLPRTANATRNWALGHPLERISPYISDPVMYGSNIPARCLIPTYPDDPKARFVEELEEATAEKAKLAGGWKTPRSLEQFWEMMAFRQECSSGRLTGFIWLVFDPYSLRRPSTNMGDSARGTATAVSAQFGQPPRLLTPEPSQGPLEAMVMPSLHATPIKPMKLNEDKNKEKKRALKGRIIPREPRVKTHQRAHFPKQTETAYYSWPEEGRGQVILDESGYTRAVELLLHLEFGTLAHAISSSARWDREVNFGRDWSLTAIGKRELSLEQRTSGAGQAVNDISSMIKKKRPVDDAAFEESNAPRPESAAVNTLSAGLVRKKAKTTNDEPASLPPSMESTKVNTLGSGLIRKKPKPASG